MTSKKTEEVKNLLNPLNPVPDLRSTMFVEAILDDYEGFRILLRGEDPNSKMLRVAFEDKLSYRNTDESYLLNIWHSNKKEIAGKTFYTVENSSYVDFFHEMTSGFYTDWEVKHYAIYTISDCVDVLSADPPTIEWLT